MTTEQMIEIMMKMRAAGSAKPVAVPQAPAVPVVAAPVVTDAVRPVEVPEHVKEPTDAELDAAIAEAWEVEGREEKVEPVAEVVEEEKPEPEPVEDPLLSILRMSADSPDKLRAVDVDRVMSEAFNAGVPEQMRAWLLGSNVGEETARELKAWTRPPIGKEAEVNPVAPVEEVKPAESEPVKLKFEHLTTGVVVSGSEPARVFVNRDAQAVVPASKMSDALAELAHVVDKKIPVLMSVLIEFGNGAVRLTGTDLSQRLEMDVEGTVSGRGSVCVNCATLAKFLKGRKGDVTLAVEGGKLLVSCGMLSSVFGTFPVEDFPCDARSGDKIVSESRVDGAGLQKALKLVSPCVTCDDTRKALNGVFLTEESKVVATDGRRVAVAEFEHGVKGFEVNKLNYDGVTVPVKSAAWIMKSKWLSRNKKSTLRVRSSESGTPSLELVGDVRYSCKLIEELYPNYKQVIPVSFMHKLKLPDLKGVIEGFETLRGVISERGWFVKMSLTGGKLRVSGSSVERGEAGFDVPGAEWNGQDCEMSFNPDYMIDAFKMGCDVWRTNEGYNPIMGVGPGVRYVIMPMRGSQKKKEAAVEKK